jgi:hypothetical protein
VVVVDYTRTLFASGTAGAALYVAHQHRGHVGDSCASRWGIADG